MSQQSFRPCSFSRDGAGNGEAQSMSCRCGGLWPERPPLASPGAQPAQSTHQDGSPSPALDLPSVRFCVRRVTGPVSVHVSESEGTRDGNLGKASSIIHAPGLPGSVEGRGRAQMVLPGPLCRQPDGRQVRTRSGSSWAPTLCSLPSLGAWCVFCLHAAVY